MIFFDIFGGHFLKICWDISFLCIEFFLTFLWGIFFGDFFELTVADLDDARFFYDRGSLVALPPDMRVRYAEQLTALLPSGGKILLVSYEYDQNEAAGPPFSVPLGNLQTLFGVDFQIELLAEEDVLWSHKVLIERGVTQLTEFAVLLTRR